MRGKQLPGREPGALLWARASALGLRVPAHIEDPYFLHGPNGPPTAPAALQGVGFAELGEPWEPLRAMERCRVRLDAITAEALVLLVLLP